MSDKVRFLVKVFFMTCVRPTIHLTGSLHGGRAVLKVNEVVLVTLPLFVKALFNLSPLLSLDTVTLAVRASAYELRN